jgi:LysM repeat protein
MENYRNADFPVSYLKLMPQEFSGLKALYLYNGTEVNLVGSIYDDQTILLVDNAENSSKYTYNGSVNADGTITGYYYRENESPAQFTWVKVCDDLGNAIDGSGLSCVEKSTSTSTTYKTEIRMVKKLIQVEEKGVFVGESRNENIPIAETTTVIPDNAIITGHIGFDETVTYKTVEVEVPEEVQVAVSDENITENMVAKKSETVKTKAKSNTTAVKETPKKAPVKVNVETAGNSLKSSATTANVPTKTVKSYEEPSTVAKPKFNSCDVGTSNPSEKIASMVRGTTLNEGGRTYHLVGSGETMTAICKMYDISIDKLASLNKKDCERIYVGEKLLVK